MKKNVATLLLLLLSVGMSGQKGTNMQELGSAYDGTFAQMHYWNYQLSAALDTNAIKDIIARERFLSENDELRVVAIKSSHTATHITFSQFYNGIEVLGGGAKVAVSKSNRLFRCIETLFPTTNVWQSPPKNFDVQAKLSNFSNLSVLKSKPVYLWSGDVLLPGWYAEFLFDEVGYADAAWLSNGSAFFLRDQNRYFNGPDSLVSVKVFHPDPITPISKVYGGQYVDLNDGNTTVLNPLRVQSSIPVNFENGVFSLKSDYVEIVEHSSPVLPVVTSTTPDFSFSRTDDGFEQVNAYYHIMKYQQYLQLMGYSLVNYAIHVDAQGFGGSDNSAFTAGTTPPRLTFGEGGVDDAEDADVIVHEYGHAISDAAAPLTNIGSERRSLDEAFGDYVAVSYTRNQYSFGNNLVFNWDGHNPFWPGRTVDNPSNFNYKTITISDIYTYTTLWNAAMFDIWDQLGKSYTDSLQFEALFGYFQNMSFAQAALMVIDADTILSGGANGIVIWKAFDERGILDWSSIAETNQKVKVPYQLFNSMTIDEPVKLMWFGDQKASLHVFDNTGRLLLTQEVLTGENILNTTLWQPGMYTLLIDQAGTQFTEKVIIIN